MRRPTAAALVIVATAVMVLAPATAGAAPPPGELWSEFPLEPPAATEPVPPEPAVVVEEPRPTQDRGAGSGARTTWLLVLLGALAAVVAGLVARLLQVTIQQQPRGEETRAREPTIVSRVERPLSVDDAGLAASATTSVGTVHPAVALPATRTAPALIETLSPQAGLAEQPEGEESETEPETLHVCEIAAWRGYVKWQFYVQSQSPFAPSFFSPYFRAPGKGTPERTSSALRAYATLREKLVAAGWAPADCGDQWFSERFRRGAP